MAIERLNDSVTRADQGTSWHELTLINNDVQEEHVYHGIGADAAWRRLTRDLIIDMQKGWALQDRPKRRSPRNKFMVTTSLIATR